MVKLEHSFQEIHSVQWLRNHLIKKFLKKKLRVSDVLLCVKKKKKRQVGFTGGGEFGLHILRKIFFEFRSLLVVAF